MIQLCASWWIACLHFTNSVVSNASLGKAFIIKLIVVIIVETFSNLKSNLTVTQSDSWLFLGVRRKRLVSLYSYDVVCETISFYMHVRAHFLPRTRAHARIHTCDLTSTCKCMTPLHWYILKCINIVPWTIRDKMKNYFK